MFPLTPFCELRPSRAETSITWNATMRLSLLTCIRNTVQVKLLILREIGWLSTRRQQPTLPTRQMSIDKLFPIGIWFLGEGAEILEAAFIHLETLHLCNLSTIACLAE